MISYIDAYKDQFGVEAICRVLRQADRGFITSRGYRKATTRVPSARALSDSLLIPEIQRVHAENFSVYGIRKMWHAMNREGFHIGRDKTARLMKLAGVSGRRRGRTPVTTISPKTPDHRPDLVQRDFRAQAPGRLWVADITYVRTCQDSPIPRLSWMYSAEKLLVLLHARRCVPTRCRWRRWSMR